MSKTSGSETRRPRLAALVLTAGLAAAAIVPASALATSRVTVGVDDHELTMVGDASGNNASVYTATGLTCPGGSPCLEISSVEDVVVADPPCVVTETGSPFYRVRCPASGIWELHLVGREGADYLRVGSLSAVGLGAQVTIEGGSGADYLRGSQAVDLLLGGTDADYIYARPGEDTALGGAGRDYLYGGRGDDTLHGGDGADYVQGRLGSDRLFGERGRDHLYGSDGDDLCSGGPQFDRSGGCEQLLSVP